MAPACAPPCPTGNHDASTASTGSARNPANRIKGMVRRAENGVRRKASGSAKEESAHPLAGSGRATLRNANENLKLSSLPAENQGMFLEVSQREVRYAGRPNAAVEGVTLGLHAGDIGVLIGPSGCGKTTLLRAVAGLGPVTGGEIRLTKSVVSSATLSVPPELRRIGMVFQDYALFPHLSVGRNVAFGIHQLPRAEQAARVAEVLQLVGLEGSENRFPHELSGGQQQRVALARALAPRPQLMLLDH